VNYSVLFCTIQRLIILSISPVIQPHLLLISVGNGSILTVALKSYTSTYITTINTCKNNTINIEFSTDLLNVPDSLFIYKLLELIVLSEVIVS
jgi:hypothetical protein